ncbi:Phospholipid phosphatase 6 [Frankliniella fusca]|uniref:Phospholipid phosphatase 6 n=1 Tax=Frankliniella fusca TaxID=407009 RepID=A0AAE1LM66_9NEOP|nr:Phospholipid phosphatase 6 [Frankliniella fusca]
MGNDNGPKRQVPPYLRTILNFDVALTNKFCLLTEKVLPQVSQLHFKYLEYSCHRVPWFVLWVAFIILWDNASLYQIQANFLYGLLLDIIVVAVIKAIVRRRRPQTSDDMLLVFGSAKYSFPSGQASRALFIAHFFANVATDLHFLLDLTLLAWSVSVCVSRVLLKRHHVLDVIIGALLGVFESYLVSYFWLNQESSLWILSVFSS